MKLPSKVCSRCGGRQYANGEHSGVPGEPCLAEIRRNNEPPSRAAYRYTVRWVEEGGERRESVIASSTEGALLAASLLLKPGRKGGVSNTVSVVRRPL